ncbi:MAG: hypothetical protein KA447_05850, partial [Pyrinomonadaceae bacterium]|nr:hypothetical protein [Pyrinomonadaceae bacterium]
MRLKGSDLFSTKLALIVFLVGTAVFGFGYFKQISVRPAAARTEAASPVRFEVKATESAPVNVADNGSPWLNLKQGKPIGSEYVGAGSAIAQFESGQLRPTALISADTNSDGLADAISGFAGADGGVITIHTASREAFAPESEATLAGLRRGEFPVAFDREARVIELPIAPEFIVSGKFTGSDLDIIVGSRTSSSIYIISSDGKGGFGSPVALNMGGNVTALAADSFAPSMARTGLVVAVNGDNESSIIVFDGQGTLGESKLRSLAVDRQIDTLVLTSPDGTTLEKDLFLLGGGTLSRINAISKGDGTPANIELPFRAAAFAAGEFVRDRRAKTELAVLGENGVVYYLKNGQLDTRPITESE